MLVQNTGHGSTEARNNFLEIPVPLSSSVFNKHISVFLCFRVRLSYQAIIADSKSCASSSGPAGRGDNFVTRCCGNVPSTSVPMSDDE